MSQYHAYAESAEGSVSAFASNASPGAIFFAINDRVSGRSSEVVVTVEEALSFSRILRKAISEAMDK